MTFAIQPQSHAFDNGSLMETLATPGGGGTVNYTYTVTLSQPVDQTADNTENSIVLDNIQFTLTDGDDGDQAFWGSDPAPKVRFLNYDWALNDQATVEE